MSVVETLFNGTLVLIPIWLGVIRYIVKETNFQNKRMANVVGLGVSFVLIGILFSMSVAVVHLIADNPQLKNALYVLFGTIALTGIGGVLFIIKEIPEISPKIVTGIPSVILLFAAAALVLPKVTNQVPPISIPDFVGSVGAGILASLLGAIVQIILEKIKSYGQELD